jgi:guanylate kinase
MTNTKKIIIIEGPSGVGKDTIINTLISKYPDRFARPINATTRQMRENESQGNPYLFLSDEEFHKLRESGEIFEHTIRHGTFRGMRKSSFDEILNNNKTPLRDCDKYGLKALKDIYGNQVTGIFLTCDKNSIKERLISRNEPLDSMNARLQDYDQCIKDAYYFDYVIENNNIETTIKEILDIIDSKNN